MTGAIFDADGYPTDATEKTVAAWPFGKFAELMDYVKQAWRYADWGWSEEDAVDDDGAKIRRFHISTAGWSGNEALIGAMRDNFIFWSQCWVQANRGGHYVFEIKAERE